MSTTLPQRHFDNDFDEPRRLGNKQLRIQERENMSTRKECNFGMEMEHTNMFKSMLLSLTIATIASNTSL